MHLTCVKKTFQYFEKATLFLLLLLGSFNFLPYFFGNATSFCSNLFLEDHLNVINLFLLKLLFKSIKIISKLWKWKEYKEKKQKKCADDKPYHTFFFEVIFGHAHKKIKWGRKEHTIR